MTITVDAAAVREVGPPVREVRLQQRSRDGMVVDEPLIIADEEHTTEEQGPPRENAADGPIELAARMGGPSPEGDFSSSATSAGVMDRTTPNGP